MMGSEKRTGFQSAVAAFVMWGALPMYWKLLHSVPAEEILAHRIIWSAVIVFIILVVQKRLPELFSLIKDKRTMLLMLGSGLLIGGNWFTYIWAVNHDRVLETSMGYFICPMVSILLGYIFFQEKIRGFMKPAVLFAIAGVLVMGLGYGKFPVTAFILAVSFGFYGLFRKKIDVKPLPGLFIEATVLMPPAFIYLLYLHMHGGGVFLTNTHDTIYLVGTGIATSVPLLLFVVGASRIRLGTIGTLQYIAPTMGFFIGAFLYNEPLGGAKVTTFVLIWIGVILYMWQLYLDTRKQI
ncbi:RarD protein, DMT superfamily transporter [Denitrovibrio acetiphilus DSM 12809]|uniref:RarD protein, DMT superfamily transporter n=1 Tax=Denitrovibrio acetiphilus (strain DSM 12809 / NBRC 114555 / N2460) TaxID=522772 RepID=D4H1K7_DENA2|nr:EamA family transporter RarD [Denitrovibrio acetiphilus]ADD68767.1 RarD protein, DMT superfamily transporter [Denitrovibrio acetiphilus DSM 12809]